MDFLNVGANTLGKIMEATSIIMRTLQAQHAEPLPPLPIDLVRLVCEYAATLDTRTAGNLYATSKDIREWVAPVRFQSIEIRNYQSFMRLRVPEVMKRISPHVFTVSLQPEAGDTCKQGGIFMKWDFKEFLDALPKLTHFHWPGLTRLSVWENFTIILPPRVVSLEVDQKFLQDPNYVLVPSSTRKHITHIVSNLFDPLKPDFFTLWSSLTHLFFEIHHSHYGYWGTSIAFCTFPAHNLPPSIKLCILMDSHSDGWKFMWSVNKALIDLVLGDIDPRIVFAVAESRERWMKVDCRETISPQRDLSWIRVGLQNAVLYDAKWLGPVGMIWTEAEKVRIRRKDSDVQAAVYRLLL